MSDANNPTALALFQHAVAEAADADAIRYFDRCISYRELDDLSSGLAARLKADGFQRGDRLAIYLQNQPNFVVALIAAWKLGGIAVPVNPMNQERELSLILEDCRPTALICSSTARSEIVASVDPAIVPPVVLTVSVREFQTSDDDRIVEWSASEPAPNCPFEPLGGEPSPHPVSARSADPALIVYTSGTTGLPKGAVISHGAFAHNAAAFRDAAQLQSGDCILGIAPLFHITGLVACLGLSFVLRCPLVLTYRFQPALVLDAIAIHRPSFVIAAYIALANTADPRSRPFGSLEKIYSGGAPVPPPFIAEFEARFGR